MAWVGAGGGSGKLSLAVLCFASTLGSILAGSIRLTECSADAPAASYRWVNSGSYLYIEGAGSCVTPSDIYNAIDDPPLVPMNAAGDELDEETG